MTQDPTTEGVVVKVKLEDKFKLLKLQTLNYQFCKAIGPQKNIFRGFIHLYQVNKLQEYVSDTEISGSKLTDGKDSVSVIDAIATVDREGKNWAVSLVNRHPSKNLECRVTMGDNLLNGTYKAKVLTGESTNSYNDIENPNRVTPKEVELKFKNGVIELPPHSLTIVHINGD